MYLPSSWLSARLRVAPLTAVLRRPISHWSAGSRGQPKTFCSLQRQFSTRPISPLKHSGNGSTTGRKGRLRRFFSSIYGQAFMACALVVYILKSALVDALEVTEITVETLHLRPDWNISASSKPLEKDDQVNDVASKEDLLLPPPPFHPMSKSLPESLLEYSHNMESLMDLDHFDPTPVSPVPFWSPLRILQSARARRGRQSASHVRQKEETSSENYLNNSNSSEKPLTYSDGTGSASDSPNETTPILDRMNTLVVTNNSSSNVYFRIHYGLCIKGSFPFFQGALSRGLYHLAPGAVLTVLPPSSGVCVPGSAEIFFSSNIEALSGTLAELKAKEKKERIESCGIDPIRGQIKFEDPSEFQGSPNPPVSASTTNGNVRPPRDSSQQSCHDHPSIFLRSELPKGVKGNDLDFVSAPESGPTKHIKTVWISKTSEPRPLDENTQYKPSFTGPGIVARTELGSTARAVGQRIVNSLSVLLSLLPDMDSIKEDYRSVELHPEITRNAHVRLGSMLSTQEKDFLMHRKEKVRVAIENMLRMKSGTLNDADVPVIAIAGSGGGYRAATSLCGFLEGAEVSGLLDAVTYIAGVSGSTFFMAQYMLSEQQPYRNRTIKDLFPSLQRKLQRDLMDVSFVIEKLQDDLHGVIRGPIIRLLGGHDLGTVDLYGSLLAHRFLDEVYIPMGIGTDDGRADKMYIPPEDVKLSHMIPFFAKGERPMPIFSAIWHVPPSFGGHYEWFEFTPFEVGIPADTIFNLNRPGDSSRHPSLQQIQTQSQIGGFVPTWSFGRTFFRGYSRGIHMQSHQSGFSESPVPELPLGLHLATFSSAFTCTVYHLAKEITNALGELHVIPQGEFLATSLLDMLSKQSDLGGSYLVEPAVFPNPFYGMNMDNKLLLDRTIDEEPRELSTLSALGNLKSIKLMDCGMEWNLPLIPLLRASRKVDIILVLDASADVLRSRELHRSLEDARSRGVLGATELVPDDAFERQVREEGVGVLSGSGELPVIIYIPLLKLDEDGHGESYMDPQGSEFGTWNLSYSPEQFSYLHGFSRELFDQRALPHIMKEIRSRIAQRRGIPGDSPSSVIPLCIDGTMVSAW